MFQIFKNKLIVETTIFINSLIYFLKKIPLVGKLFKESLYGEKEGKLIFTIISTLGKVLSEVAKKSLYILVFIYLPSMFVKDFLFEDLSIEASVIYIFLILNFIYGSLVRCKIGSSEKIDYYMIMLMRVNPKYYYLTNILVRSISSIILFFPIFLIIKFSFLKTLVYLSLLALIRIIGEAVAVIKFDKMGIKEGLESFLMFVFLISTLLVAYLPLIFNNIPDLTNVLLNPILIIIVGILAALSLVKLVNYNEYKKLAIKTLNRDNIVTVDELKSQSDFFGTSIEEKDVDEELLDTTKFNNKSGYEYLNEIFFYRHKKLVKDSIKAKVYVILIAFVAVFVGVIFLKEQRVEILNFIETSIAMLFFILYMLCNTDKLTKAMFANCDMSLLKYNYYREANAILDSFKIRLKKILSFNLPPILILCVALQIICMVCGGGNVVKMGFIYVAILAMTLFYSVFYLAAYYIFQPYTSDLTIKNPFFNLINWVVYGVAYSCLRIKISSNIEMLLISILLLVLSVLLVVLVYKIAPKSFKVK